MMNELVIEMMNMNETMMNQMVMNDLFCLCFNALMNTIFFLFLV